MIIFCKNNCGNKTANPDGICHHCKNKEQIKALERCKKGFVN